MKKNIPDIGLNSEINAANLPGRIRPPWIHLTILLVLILTSCKSKDENYVKYPTLGALRHLALAHYYKDHVVYIDATEGDPRANKEIAKFLGDADWEAMLKKLTKEHIFSDLKPLAETVWSNPGYSSSLADPLHAQPSTLTGIMKQLKIDGLLWIHREYRIRSVRGFSGDRHTKWTGEVSSQMYVFDATTGDIVLKINWLTESTTKREGSTLSGEDTIQLLSNAVTHTAEDSTDLLLRAASGKGIQAGLKDDNQSESAQENAHTVSELGIFARGLLVFLLTLITVVSFKSSSGFSKLFGVASLGTMIYLLFLRGWWKDTILAILQFIKEAIFG